MRAKPTWITWRPSAISSNGGRLRLTHVLVAIHLQSRETAVLAIAEHFDTDFMALIARNLTMTDA